MDGLDDIVAGAGAAAGHRSFDVSVAGDDDDAGVRRSTPSLGQDVLGRAVGKFPIEKNNRDSVPARKLKQLLRRASVLDGVAFELENVPEINAGILVVINN